MTVSILAGIAIIPLQLSELAEAYFQRERELLPDECRISEAAGEGDLGVQSAQEAQLADTTCGACGAVGHRRDAAFCYHCGEAIQSVEGSV